MIDFGFSSSLVWSCVSCVLASCRISFSPFSFACSSSAFLEFSVFVISCFLFSASCMKFCVCVSSSAFFSSPFAVRLELFSLKSVMACRYNSFFVLHSVANSFAFVSNSKSPSVFFLCI